MSCPPPIPCGLAAGLLIDDAHFVVRVKASAREGKANKAVIRALGRYFGVTPSQAEIVSGYKSRKKVVAIN